MGDNGFETAIKTRIQRQEGGIVWADLAGTM